MKRFPTLFASLGMIGFACIPATTTPPDPTPAACEYPPATEPMAEDQALGAYRWAEANNAAGDVFELDLAHAPCDDDAVIDWSPFEALLFISVPAW